MTRGHGPRRVNRLALAVVLTAVLGACASDGETPIDAEVFVPRLIGDTSAVAGSDPGQLRRFDLVATNLVSALVQIPELDPAGTTLQINAPVSVFGNVVLRALEDAGYGLQLVDADQGKHFVSYSERYANTERGPVLDFALVAGNIGLSREYVQNGESIYPDSLMTLIGTDADIDIGIADEAFRVQGDDGAQYVSGVQGSEVGIRDSGAIETVDVRDYDARPLADGSSLENVLARVRDQVSERAASRPSPDLDTFDRYRRTVMIFDSPTTLIMGEPNKRALRLVVRELVPGDLLVIRACHDADGNDQAARTQAVRVVEELASHDVPSELWWIAPCRRAAYQLSTDQASPVELIHYRPKV